MDYGTQAHLGVGFFMIFGIWSLVGLAVYVWYLWALSRLFPYLGLPSGWGWIPVFNQWQLLQRGGIPGWLVLLGIVPGLGIVVLIVSIIAIHRINGEFGRGGGFTVLGAFIPPLWATIFASQLRDQEFGAQGYAPASGSGSEFGPAAAFDGANDGFAPVGYASQADFTGAPAAPADPAWQGLPPVPQPQSPSQPAQDPWSLLQLGEGADRRAAERPANAWPDEPNTFDAPVPDPLAPRAPGAPAQQTDAPRVSDWGFSRTTEGDYERLAAEGAVPAAPAPLGGVAPPQPFSWPVADAASTGRVSGPVMMPAPPADQTPGPRASASGPAQAAEAEPAAETPAAPAPAPAPAPAELQAESFAHGPSELSPKRVEPEAPSNDPAASPVAQAPIPRTPAIQTPVAPTPVAPAPVAPAPIASASAPDDFDLDEDRTVVVSRRARWGIELPGGETLELPGDDVVVGRKPTPIENSSVLQISDPTRTMSKSHVRLRRNGDDWTIEDLNSTNGLSVVSASGDPEPLEAGQVAPATEHLVIGTLEVRLVQLS